MTKKISRILIYKNLNEVNVRYKNGSEENLNLSKGAKIDIAFPEDEKLSKNATSNYNKHSKKEY